MIYGLTYLLGSLFVSTALPQLLACDEDDEANLLLVVELLLFIVLVIVDLLCLS